MANLREIGLALAMMDPYTRPAAQAVANWRAGQAGREVQQEYLDMAQAREERAAQAFEQEQNDKMLLGGISAKLAQNPYIKVGELFQTLEALPDHLKEKGYAMGVNHLQTMSRINTPRIDALMEHGGSLTAGDPTHKALGQMGMGSMLQSSLVGGHDPGLDPGPLAGPGVPVAQTRPETWSFKTQEQKLREKEERETQSFIGRRRKAIQAGVMADPTRETPRTKSLERMGWEDWRKIPGNENKSYLDYRVWTARQLAQVEREELEKDYAAGVRARPKTEDKTEDPGKKLLNKKRTQELAASDAYQAYNNLMTTGRLPSPEVWNNMPMVISTEKMQEAVSKIAKAEGLPGNYKDIAEFLATGVKPKKKRPWYNRGSGTGDEDLWGMAPGSQVSDQDQEKDEAPAGADGKDAKGWYKLGPNGEKYYWRK